MIYTPEEETIMPVLCNILHVVNTILSSYSIQNYAQECLAIHNLVRHHNTLLVDFPLGTQVEVYGGVMDSNSKLVNCNQFVPLNCDEEVSELY